MLSLRSVLTPARKRPYPIPRASNRTRASGLLSAVPSVRCGRRRAVGVVRSGFGDRAGDVAGRLPVARGRAARGGDRLGRGFGDPVARGGQYRPDQDEREPETRGGGDLLVED